MRLDCYLFEMGLVQSRQKAQELISSGVVWVNHKMVKKNSFDVNEDFQIQIKQHRQWVARSAEKLYGFVKACGIEIEGKEALDVGSSTGGFSEVLLESGVKSVVCVDVGTNQLHPKIYNDKRVRVFENQDIRSFVHPPFDLVVCDVSFISLSLIVQKIYELTSKECVLLFKPQFEVGRGVRRNKRGVIMDSKKAQQSLEEFLPQLKDLGFEIKNVQKSLLKGKCGNEEFFIYLCK